MTGSPRADAPDKAAESAGAALDALHGAFDALHRPADALHNRAFVPHSRVSSLHNLGASGFARVVGDTGRGGGVLGWGEREPGRAGRVGLGDE